MLRWTKRLPGFKEETLLHRSVLVRSCPSCLREMRRVCSRTCQASCGTGPRQTDRQTETDRQTDRQTNRPTDRKKKESKCLSECVNRCCQQAWADTDAVAHARVRECALRADIVRARRDSQRAQEAVVAVAVSLLHVHEERSKPSKACERARAEGGNRRAIAADGKRGQRIENGFEDLIVRAVIRLQATYTNPA
jgi:hypothetical protein